MMFGKCRWCDDLTDIFRDNRLCEYCDGNVIRCTVCRNEQHLYNHCRHVFQDESFQWRGAGCDAHGGVMMKPFHRFLSAMGEDFARDLKVAIKSGKFYTWIVAPMIGGGGHMTLYGMAGRNEWGNKIIDLGESDRAVNLHEGYCWLSSLHTTKTKIANKTTLKWIDRWLWPLTPEKLL